MRKKTFIAFAVIFMFALAGGLSACKGNKDKTVESIEVKTNPTKVIYQTGESLDLSGGVITVKYSDNTAGDIFMTDPLVSAGGFNSDAPGTKTVSLIYKERSTSFTVTVETAKEIKSIAVKTAPKSEYALGQDFDPSGGVIKVTYDDDSTGDVAMTASGVTVTGYNKNSVGTQTLTVTYKSKSAIFSVTVNPPDTKTGSYTEAEIKAIYASELVGWGDSSKMFAESAPSDLKGAVSAIKFTNKDYSDECATFYFYANDYYATAKEAEFSALATAESGTWIRDGHIIVVGYSRVVNYYLTTPKLLTAAFTKEGYTVSQVAKDAKGNDSIEIKKNNVLEIKIVFFDNWFMAARAQMRMSYNGGDKYDPDSYTYDENNYEAEAMTALGGAMADSQNKILFYGTENARSFFFEYLNGNG